LAVAASVALALASGVACAGTVSVTAASGEPLVVVLDGKVAGPAPIDLPSLTGVHELGFRSTTFGSTVFTQSVDVPGVGAIRVVADLAGRTATVQAPAKPAVAPPTASATAVGDLYVVSDKPGASIFLDGVDTGKLTPTMLSGVPVGPHAVEVRTNCARGEGDANVQAVGIARSELVLVAGTGGVDISAWQPGATVLLDGVDVGKVPYTADKVSCGPHKLVLRAPGFVEHTSTLDVRAFETAKAQIALLKEGNGALVVTPTPAEAAIAIDGVAAGTGALTIDPIGAGTHQVALSASGYTTATKSAVIVADQTTRLEVTLAPVASGPPQKAPKPGETGSANAGPLAPPVPRIALDSTAAAGGAVFAAGGLYEYLQARKAYADYRLIPDDATAEAFYDATIVPLTTKAVVFGATGAVLLGSSAVLFATTHFHGKESDIRLEGGPTWVGIAIRE
jgi:hypothetical protein